MTRAEFGELVKNEYHYNWDDLICKDQVSNIIDNAIKYALTYSEVIKTVDVVSNTVIPDAVAIVKCVPMLTCREDYIVYRDLYQALDMGLGLLDHVNYEFIPAERRIFIFPPMSARVHYVKDPALLEFEDLTPKMIMWAKEYAIALINCREGALGSQALVTFMPFTLNYSELLEQGMKRKQELEQEIKKYHYGLFGAMNC